MCGFRGTGFVCCAAGTERHGVVLTLSKGRTRVCGPNKQEGPLTLLVHFSPCLHQGLLLYHFISPVGTQSSTLLNGLIPLQGLFIPNPTSSFCGHEWDDLGAGQLSEKGRGAVQNARGG